MNEQKPKAIAIASCSKPRIGFNNSIKDGKRHPPVALQAEILAELTKEPQYSSRLERVCRVGNPAIHAALDALIAAGKVTKDEGRFGKYRLASAAPVPVPEPEPAPVAQDAVTDDDLADQVIAHVASLMDANHDADEAQDVANFVQDVQKPAENATCSEQIAANDVDAALNRLRASLQAPVIAITDYDLKLSVLSRLGEIVEASIADVLLSLRSDLQTMGRAA